MRTGTVHAAAFAAALAVAAVASAAEKPAAGSLSVEDGRGVVEIKGQGQVIGRIQHGTLLIIDLSPNDRFAPRLNGIAKGVRTTWRGVGGSFYVPGGRYRVVMRGAGISIAARGKGVALLDGEPAADGAVGIFDVGVDADCSDEETIATACEPLPDSARRVPFGAEGAAAKGVGS